MEREIGRMTDVEREGQRSKVIKRATEAERERERDAV